MVRLPKARKCFALGCARSKKLIEAVDRLEENVIAFKLQMVDRKASKEVAMDMSKIKYLFSLFWVRRSLVQEARRVDRKFFCRRCCAL